MEQPDESTVKNSGNKPPSPQNSLETPSSATNNEREIANRQELSDSETINVNRSGNPSIRPETQSSSPTNHQSPDPSSSSPPPLPLTPSPPLPPPPKIDVPNPKSTSVSRAHSDGSDDDFPVSSMPDPGPAIQNPPVQVMERAEEPDTPSAYRIPSHVFDRTNTGTPEWSVASNESLFSIHMGNMSFSKELNWLNSEMSGPLPPLTSDHNNGGNTNNQSQDNKPNDPSTSNQSQVNNLNDAGKSDQSQTNKPNVTSTGDQSQANKFSDMSESVGRFHEDYDPMIEAKAAETMRQVIMENSEDYDLLSVSVASRADESHHNNNNTNNIHELSRHSDCSTKSFAFNSRPEGEKSQRSPKGVQEKPKQKTPAETGTPKESSNSKASSQASKQSSNAPFKWFCCFTCCIK